MTTRKLVQVVELDIKRCSLSYGAGACTAVLGTSGTRKCYNTFKTCQDAANYAEVTETLRFGTNIDALTSGEDIYPALVSVSTNPSIINLSGITDRVGPLGKRARVTIKLKDFADSDIWFDRYQSERVSGAAQSSGVGFNPLKTGTFFPKLRRRYPYYVGRPIRVLEGEEGQALSAMRTRHYVVSEISGPDGAGNVTIVAKDILDVAEDDKALCPKQNSGKLAEDLAIDGTSLELTPAGIGDAEYAASGYASVGSEVVSFTRSGDVVTLTGRGLEGSTAETHGAGDIFQQAYRVENTPIADISDDLLRNYTNGAGDFITLSEWQAEGSAWMPGVNLTATIVEPTGVTKLLAELAQFGVSWFWDEINQKIEMRAVRPLDFDETAPKLNDDEHFLAQSVKVEDRPQRRLSSVVFWHGIIDVTGSQTDGANYKRASVSTVADDPYEQAAIHTIYSRWLGVGQDSIASAVTQRLLSRFKDIPRVVTFSCDIKDDAALEPAAPVDITTRNLADEDGLPEEVRMQITSIEETVPGHRLEVVAETYDIDVTRQAFFTENARPVYDSSSDAEKEKGFYFIDEAQTEFADGGLSYKFY